MTRRAAAEAVLTVERVGVRGDGIAHHGGRPVYLPFTAPGDRVRARLGARRGEGITAAVVELLAPGERREPVCPHFGHCGGCALQHLADEAYIRAKEAQVAAALAQHGLAAAEMMPLRRVAPGTRRRARFSLHRPRAAAAPAVIGFNARGSHRIVDMRSCAVLDPALFALVAPLRRLAAALWPAETSGAATVTKGYTGIDCLLDLPAVPGLPQLEAIAAFAEAQDLARLAWRSPGLDEPTPAALRRPAQILLSGVPVALPFDAFLQASPEAETALVAEVVEGVGPARRVADLHAGLGTFTFALARGAAVHAVESARASAAALAAAASRAGFAGRVTSEVRDLEARPLGPEELAGYDAVVFDPPRAGARAQCAMLARAAARRIVAVSCNPASFARDARLLVDGGYRLRRVQPVDQFVWSSHVELVACFERPG